jgi:hypothetical protein
MRFVDGFSPLSLPAPWRRPLPPGGGPSAIRSQDLREWLTYIASDELQGRAVFSPGIGLAAAYIEDQLRAWGVKPAGEC